MAKDEINLVYAIPHAFYAGFIPEVQARELFDEIQSSMTRLIKNNMNRKPKLLKPLKVHTLTPPRSPYKILLKKGENPWNKITKDVTFPKLETKEDTNIPPAKSQSPPPM